MAEIVISRDKVIKLLEIADGLCVQPRKVVAIKRSELEDEKCTVFLAGQSAVDGGFLVDREYEDVRDEVNSALAGLDDEEDAEENKSKEKN